MRSTGNGETWDNADSPGTSSTNRHFGVTFYEHTLKPISSPPVSNPPVILHSQTPSK
ncbi:MAG: hypothetical protein HOC18_07790 [Candidatus Marinimicrobia bacterium]|nr:hypothetical protein [Candidatus Neomarinimicrobiota bacterium]